MSYGSSSPSWATDMCPLTWSSSCLAGGFSTQLPFIKLPPLTKSLLMEVQSQMTCPHPESTDHISTLIRGKEDTCLLNTYYVWGTMLSPYPILNLDDES